ncbi:hydantoinase/oxoprolinase family protein [Enterovirga sp.]|uniref:hydantoinase/oxoprolinase family protein n=1 Tax=Enterovirga sp. TaxID=2026350 RepID=UPI00260C1C9D|nr:hydantoinase/oxoprolinase family protein [Enterovirga sp.]MDB5591981.1 5-oxoprolinase [Enterovirga sp.]
MSRAGTTYEIGIDTGGTFTDMVCRGSDGSVRLKKVPSTRSNPSAAILSALAFAQSEWGVASADVTLFAHGTTVATNAVLERRGARTGIITTAGFRDVLENGRQSRRDMYDLALRAQPPVYLAPRRDRKEVRERLDGTGQVVVPLDEADVRRAVAELVEAGIEAIAVCLLFSFLDPTHEKRIAAIIGEMAPDMPVSLSHEVDPAFREYERTCVTAFDAYVKPVVARYLADVEAGLLRSGIHIPLQVMQSRGGLASAPIAGRRPVRLFLSGPAGGVIGGLDVGMAAGHRDLITVDIGGTSCDIALITDGRPLIRTEGLIDGFTVRVPMVDVTAVGSGGGSIAWMDAAGSLKVGPQSAGSEPGPACYGRGGTAPTVTDASLVLGYIDPASFAGGALGLRPELSAAAIRDTVARPLGLSDEDAALGIHRVVNTQMAESIRLVSIGRGIDPRRYALLPLGGGGPMHATALAEELGIDTIIVPPNPGVLAAAGLLGAPIEHEVSAAFPRRLADVALPELTDAFAGVEARCRELITAEGVPEARVQTAYALDLCYVGQSYHIEVPFDPAAAEPLQRAYEDFLDAHDRIYGHRIAHPAKIVNLRVVQRAPSSGGVPMRAAETGTPPAPGRRMIRVRQHAQRVEAAIWQREAIGPDTQIRGPAIIDQADTTTLVEPGWTARLAEGGALLIERETAA